MIYSIRTIEKVKDKASGVIYNVMCWVLSNDNKKMLASIGRESEKSSKEDYEGIQDKMIREGLFFPLKRKSEKWKCHGCLLIQSSREEAANIKEKKLLKKQHKTKTLKWL